MVSYPTKVYLSSGNVQWLTFIGTDNASTNAVFTFKSTNTLFVVLIIFIRSGKIHKKATHKAKNQILHDASKCTWSEHGLTSHMSYKKLTKTSS